MKFLDSLEGKKDSPIDSGNPALLRAMHEVATNDNSDNRKTLYEALLASMLLIAVPELPKGLGPGVQTLQVGVQLPLSGIVDANQIKTMPAFTDLEALRNWDPNTPYIGLKAIELFRLLLGTDIQDVLINPFDPIRKMIRPGGRVKRAEIEVLAKGVVPSNMGQQQIQLKAQEKVLIGLPANPPSEAILELLRGQAKEIPVVAELYYFLMARGQSAPELMIGIVLSHDANENEKQAISQALGKTIQPALKPNEFLNFMFLSGPFGQNIQKIGRLIYPRS
jgi:hypothetical protein